MTVAVLQASLQTVLPSGGAMVWALLRSGRRRQCCHCRAMLATGLRYVRATVSQDGATYRFRFCCRCAGVETR